MTFRSASSVTLVAFAAVVAACSGSSAAKSGADSTANAKMPDSAAGAVWDAVRRLPDRQRSIVVLHYVDQLSTAEIGDLLGLSASTVQTHLARSRDRLAVLLEATLPDATPRKEGDHR